jgi:hypothetical protein
MKTLKPVLLISGGALLALYFDWSGLASDVSSLVGGVL